MRVNSSIQVIAACLLSICTGAVGAQTIRDYYAEPGINPFKEPLGQHFNEQIDPFSGGLSLGYTDIHIPGNGGFDIKVNRTYNSVQNALGTPGVNGLGWTMHMGRIVVDSPHADKICVQGNWAVSMIDNPSIEHGDGGREILLLATDANAYLITRSRWKAECNPGNGLIVTAPDGTRYTMSQYGFSGYGIGEVYWYATHIEDLNGNTLTIDYATTNGVVHMNRITASDGRIVDFTYEAGVSGAHLASVSGGGQTWAYHYTPVSGRGDGYEHLSEVVRPDGTRWVYDYHPQYTEGTAGSYSLRRVTYPHGATITYTYGYVYFDPADVGAPTTVVTRKVTGGTTASGTWTFDYVAGVTNNSAVDKTTVNAPDGTYVYYHWGYSGTANGSVWKVGLQHGRQVYQGGQLIEQVVNEWGSQVVSNENYWHGRHTSRIDVGTRAPLLMRRDITRDGSLYTTSYSTHDQYGNPQTKTETSNFYYGGSGTVETRTINLTYQIDAARWLINLPKNESRPGFGTIERTYDSAGNMRSENRYGVLTSYTYTGQGDVASKTDARTKTTRYESYHRGIPQREIQANDVVTTRVVNASGTVASETNGRGYTTAFTYDSMHRLEGIDFTINADVLVTHSANIRKVVRGAYEREDVLDGFARPVRVTHRDTARGVSIITTHEYDALGNKVFESNPNSTEGTRYSYDVLGRVTRVEHPDGSARTVSYQDPNEGSLVTVVDERGNTTKTLYGAYGDPSQSFYLRTDSPEGIQTALDRNVIGQIESVWQGALGGTGFTRTYVYDSRTFLASRTDPEIGTTTYGRDAVGNMTSKTIGTQPTVNYIYDDLNRLETIDYPSSGSSEVDVSFGYNENGSLLTVANTESQRTYSYDENENLINESISIGTSTYGISYGYSDLDFIDTIRYPSNRLVTYSPDALGRATRATPYLTSVDYHPSGHVEQMAYANGRTVNVELDSRLWVSRIHSPQSAIVDLNYTYDGLGNVEAINNGLTPSYNQSFTYDGVNRLIIANGIWGQGSIQYDLLGNITRKTLGGTDYSYTYSGIKLSRVRGSNSFSFQYTASGAISTDGDYNYVYDAADNMTSGAMIISGKQDPDYDPTVHFAYDGNNMRVRRTHMSDTKHYVFASSENLLAEYTVGQRRSKEYIYLGNRLVARVEGDPLPVANAGVDQTVPEASQVALDGGGSTDQYETIIAYSWTQTGGPIVSLTGAGTSVAQFTAPSGVVGQTTLTFQLTVTNSLGDTGTDTTAITVQMVDSDRDGLSDYWETQYFGTLVQSGGGDYDGDGYSDAYEFENGTDPVVPAQLTEVLGLHVQPANTSNILTWEPVDRAQTYDLYWSTTPDIVPASANKIAGATSPYFHTGLTNGQKYYYKVIAGNACCESSSEVFVAAPGTTGWVGRTAVLGSMHDGMARSNYNAGHSGVHYTEATEDGRALFAKLYSDDTGWSAPHQIDVVQSNSLVRRDIGFPRLVRGSDGSAIMVWSVAQRAPREPTAGVSTEFRNTLYARRYVEGVGWGPETTLWDSGVTTAPGRVYSVAILGTGVVDAAGNVTFVYIVSSETVSQLGYTLDEDAAKSFYAARYEPGTGWLSAETIATTTETVSRECVICRYEANIGVSQTTGRVSLVYGVTRGKIYETHYDPDGGWSPVSIVGEGWNPQVTLDATGGIAVGYTGSSIEGVGFRVRHYQSGAWSVPEMIGSGSSDWDFAGDASGNLIAVWHVQSLTTSSSVYPPADCYFDWETYRSIKYARYSVATGRWTTPERLPASSVIPPDACAEQFLTGLSVDAKGAMHLGVYEYVVTEESWGDGEFIDYQVTADGSLRDAEFVETGGGGGLVGDTTGNVLAHSERFVSRFVVLPGAPHAYAGENLRVTAGELVALDASRSTDIGGAVAGYGWEQLSGELVTLTNASSEIASFVAPPVSTLTELIFKLQVYDSEGLSSYDTVRVVVSPPNAVPIANAGPDQSVLWGDAVVLDGSGSYDSDGSLLGYSWRQTAGPFAVTIDSDESLVANFSLPATPLVEGPAQLTFELKVHDNLGGTSTDRVVVTIDTYNAPPVASAGQDQNVSEGSSVMLDASASYDPDGAISSYSWAQTGGPAVTLAGADTAWSSFTAPQVAADTQLTFELTVTDTGGAAATDAVGILVTDVPVPIDSTPPVTSASVVRSTAKGIAYFDITLTANESAATYFRLTGQGTVVSGGSNSTAWQTYNGAVRVENTKNGASTFEYYSIDTAGNQETAQARVLQ